MILPDVLEKAGEELRNAQAAWLLVQVAGDDINRRQYADETLYALRRAVALFDEWFFFGDAADAAVVDGGPF